MKTKILFVCTANQQRSPTAESLFTNNEEYETKSVGIHPMAEIPISSEAIEWADRIVCMEEEHKEFIEREFPIADKKQLIVLNIPDVYSRDDPDLIMSLKEKLSENGIKV
ncbi:MAG: phosphotyrosine protein phosphatase [Nanoarchaeota archaeon]|nr:phosphotyrosine protein phosphatase [Nanoarchaeota archaeon]